MSLSDELASRPLQALCELNLEVAQARCVGSCAHYLANLERRARSEKNARVPGTRKLEEASLRSAFCIT
jgi:hypothetical protein